MDYDEKGSSRSYGDFSDSVTIHPLLLNKWYPAVRAGFFDAEFHGFFQDRGVSLQFHTGWHSLEGDCRRAITGKAERNLYS
jgi:hypothetical protein